jgi:hypothetical protein
MNDALRNFLKNQLKNRFGADLVFCAYREREGYAPRLLIVPTDMGYRSAANVLSSLFQQFPAKMKEFSTIVQPYSRLLQMARIGEPEVLSFFHDADEEDVFGNIEAFDELRETCRSEEGFDADQLVARLRHRRNDAEKRIAELQRRLFTDLYSGSISALQLSLLENRRAAGMQIGKQYLSDYSDPDFGRTKFPHAIEELAPQGSEDSAHLQGHWNIARETFRVLNSIGDDEVSSNLKQQLHSWFGGAHKEDSSEEGNGE